MDSARAMRAALREAERAYARGEVPIGAVVVCGGRIVGRGHNQTELLGDPTAHAEMLAITAAVHSLGGKYLDQCSLHVTVEPCVMCAGALLWSRVGALHYAARDAKRGYSLHSPCLLHPRTRVYVGELESESVDLLRRFFAIRR